MEVWPTAGYYAVGGVPASRLAASSTLSKRDGNGSNLLGKARWSFGLSCSVSLCCSVASLAQVASKLQVRRADRRVRLPDPAGTRRPVGNRRCMAICPVCGCRAMCIRCLTCLCCWMGLGGLDSARRPVMRWGPCCCNSGFSLVRSVESLRFGFCLGLVGQWLIWHARVESSETCSTCGATCARSACCAQDVALLYLRGAVLLWSWCRRASVASITETWSWSWSPGRCGRYTVTIAGAYAWAAGLAGSMVISSVEPKDDYGTVYKHTTGSTRGSRRWRARRGRGWCGRPTGTSGSRMCSVSRHCRMRHSVGGLADSRVFCSGRSPCQPFGSKLNPLQAGWEWSAIVS